MTSRIRGRPKPPRWPIPRSEWPLTKDGYPIAPWGVVQDAPNFRRPVLNHKPCTLALKRKPFRPELLAASRVESTAAKKARGEGVKKSADQSADQEQNAVQEDDQDDIWWGGRNLLGICLLPRGLWLANWSTCWTTRCFSWWWENLHFEWWLLGGNGL